MVDAPTKGITPKEWTIDEGLDARVMESSF